MATWGGASSPWTPSSAPSGCGAGARRRPRAGAPDGRRSESIRTSFIEGSSPDLARARGYDQAHSDLVRARPAFREGRTTEAEVLRLEVPAGVHRPVRSRNGPLTEP